LIKYACKKMNKTFSPNIKAFTKEGVTLFEEDDLMLLKD
jgi:hypothetical protein